MNQEFRLLIPRRVADLLFEPVQGWVRGNSKVDDPSVFQFHNDKDVDLGEEEGELDAEIEGPDGGGMVLQKRAPLLVSMGRFR